MLQTGVHIPYLPRHVLTGHVCVLLLVSCREYQISYGCTVSRISLACCVLQLHLPLASSNPLLSASASPLLVILKCSDTLKLTQRERSQSAAHHKVQLDTDVAGMRAKGRSAFGNALCDQSIIQSINIFNVHSLRKETTTCIWFTQSYKVCNGTTVMQEVQML